jgi:hypothetical protein
MVRVRLLFIVANLIMLGGCAYHYTPSASRRFEPITEFSSHNSVALLNGQPSTQEVRIGSAGFYPVYANYNAWTNTAIEIASRELGSRGLTIVPAAARTITLSVENASYTTGMVELKCEITMKATTSDGYSTVYVGENASIMAGYAPHIMDGAMMRVVHEMLNHPRVVAFLTQ